MCCLLGLGCSARQAPPAVSEAQLEAWNAPPTAEAAAHAPAAPSGVLWRDEVQGALDAGLGAFLRRVAVAPELDGYGRFAGFRVLALGPAEFWQNVDLRPGDVVTDVNDLPIERETQAYRAFRSLEQAEELRVGLLRNGRRHTLTFRIEARPAGGEAAGAAAPSKPATPAAGKAPAAPTPNAPAPDSSSAGTGATKRG